MCDGPQVPVKDDLLSLRESVAKFGAATGHEVVAPIVDHHLDAWGSLRLRVSEVPAPGHGLWVGDRRATLGACGASPRPPRAIGSWCAVSWLAVC